MFTSDRTSVLFEYRSLWDTRELGQGAETESTGKKLWSNLWLDENIAVTWSLEKTKAGGQSGIRV